MTSTLQMEMAGGRLLHDNANYCAASEREMLRRIEGRSKKILKNNGSSTNRKKNQEWTPKLIKCKIFVWKLK